MTAYSSLLTLVFALVAFGGAAVVLVRDPNRQIFVAGVQGLFLTLLFYLLHSPDVALSQLVVGSIAIPMLVLLTLARLDEPR